LSEIDGNKLFLMIGPSIVRHMSRGNYVLRLINANGDPIGKKVLIWNVRNPLKENGWNARNPLKENEPSKIKDPPEELDNTSSQLDELRELVNKAEEDGNDTELEEYLLKFLTLLPEDKWALQKLEDLRVNKEEKKLKNFMVQAEKAYEKKEFKTAQKFLDNIDTMRPAYPPAEELKKKLKERLKGTIKARKKKIIWGISLAFAGIALILLWFFFHSKHNPKQQNLQVVLDACQNGTMTSGQCYKEAQRILAQVKDAPDQNLVALAEIILESSASAGYGEANRILGHLYDPSSNLTPDRRTQRSPRATLAYDYYKKAIDQGAADACEDLMRLHDWVQNHAFQNWELSLLLTVKQWNLSNCGR